MTLQTHEEEEILATVRALDVKIATLAELANSILAEVRAFVGTPETEPVRGKKKQRDVPPEPSPFSAAAEPELPPTA